MNVELRLPLDWQFSLNGHLSFFERFLGCGAARERMLFRLTNKRQEKLIQTEKLVRLKFNHLLAYPGLPNELLQRTRKHLDFSLRL